MGKRIREREKAKLDREKWGRERWRNLHGTERAPLPTSGNTHIPECTPKALDP